MMKDLDYYEVFAVIAPGMVLIIGAVFLFFPEKYDTLNSLSNVSLGSLGVGMLLAYVAGQLLQAVGNIIEQLWWWSWQGKPLDWIRSGKHELVAGQQRATLQTRVGGMLHDPGFTFAGISPSDWFSVTRQLYAAVAASGRAARIDIFNGNYGLCRGIAAAFLVLVVSSFFTKSFSWRTDATLVALATIATFRMHRFGVRYGRELCVQYLQLPDANAEGGNI